MYILNIIKRGIHYAELFGDISFNNKLCLFTTLNYLYFTGSSWDMAEHDCRGSANAD